jgi:hypothetical protein
MKKVVTLILFLSIIKINFAQSITDTTGYLRDSILARKSFYIGKPLSVLLTNLKIQVKSYTDRIPFDNEPDTIQFKVTSLQFYSSAVLLNRSNHNIKTPNIGIVFLVPIKIPKRYFKHGQLLDWTTEWTPAKAAFFGSYIISDLQVRL